MMRTLFLTLMGSLFLLSSPGLRAQGEISDTINDIAITPVTHGSLLLEYKGTTIYIDPYGGPSLYENLPKPDLILITDIHGDHLNKETLFGLPTMEADLVVPPAVDEMLEEKPFKKVTILRNAETTRVRDIEIEAIPMYNLPETADSRHPKGRGNGYILTLGDKRIYISGDTEDIPEMRNLKDIDIAFVCMNMPYTMTVEQAADAVNAFKPAIVYPYHYRGRPDMSDTQKFKTLVESVNETTEVRLRDWYRQ